MQGKACFIAAIDLTDLLHPDWISFYDNFHLKKKKKKERADTSQIDAHTILVTIVSRYLYYSHWQTNGGMFVLSVLKHQHLRLGKVITI